MKSKLGRKKYLRRNDQKIPKSGEWNKFTDLRSPAKPKHDKFKENYTQKCQSQSVFKN